MSLLAEPRRKQKISEDPQNISWRDDDSKFGKVMLEKMGWKPGHGLGKDGQGMSENLELKPNTLTKGLGSAERSDEVWIAHHDSFATLLAELNRRKKSTISEVKNSPHRVKPKAVINVHKQEMRPKDLSQIAEKDKCAIFGRKATKETVKNIERRTEDKVRSEEPSNANMTVSELSSKDYFAEKMRKLSKRRKV